MRWRQWSLLAVVFAVAALAMTFKIAKREKPAESESASIIEMPSELEDTEPESGETLPTVEPEHTEEPASNIEHESTAKADTGTEASGSSQPDELPEQIPLEAEVLEHLMSRCKEYDVPLSLALAVIETESGFHSDAKNGNCVGYMQINSINTETLSEAIGITDLTDPYQNISSGVYMLGVLHTKYQDWSKALISYNFGENGAYRKYFSAGVYSTKYSRKVLSLQEKWEKVTGW